MYDILNMTALQLGSAIKKGEISSPEVVGMLFDAIEAKDKIINAYITLNREAATARAQEVQKKINSGELTSPLAGVPVAVKDNICTKGLKTSCASKILGDFTPPYNATVIERLEAAGVVIAGKLNMDEFAMGSTNETSYYGPVKNPWNTSRVSGGSSGGAAAAVAAREAVCALGSDTGGSIRQPASYCGVTGFKPTYGTVSRYGLIAYASSLDQIGPVARDVADCAAILNIICGHDSADSTSLDITHPDYLASLGGEVKGMKIGLPRECFEAGLDDDVAERVKAAAEALHSAGAVVDEVSLPFLDYMVPTYYIIACAEASSNLSRFDGVKYGIRGRNYDGLTDLYNTTRSEGFGDEVKKRILLGTFVLSSGYYDAYYRKALQVKAIIKNHFDAIFEKYDLIICPTSPRTAPRLGESLSDPLKMYLSDIFTASANIAGLPGLSVPCGFDREGLPVGMQIIGQRLDEVKVLRAGYAYQQLTSYHKTAPGGELK
ncbi:MAG: Asp-tRNA(Asn)/Glu-tRNA(Gln) amidotransferase subunit GatA [Clostridiales bacterium]|nr:Asp-tRNA(Asn)/Glu-tRNA(Gln) amidotransferase subunit GatA [Clostridiales bacterium]